MKILTYKSVTLLDEESTPFHNILYVLLVIVQPPPQPPVTTHVLGVYTRFALLSLVLCPLIIAQSKHAPIVKLNFGEIAPYLCPVLRVQRPGVSRESVLELSLFLPLGFYVCGRVVFLVGQLFVCLQTLLKIGVMDGFSRLYQFHFPHFLLPLMLLMDAYLSFT